MIIKQHGGMRATYCVYLLFFYKIVITYTITLTSLEDIIVFSNKDTYVRNATNLLEKLNNVIQMGPDRLLIITDYDETLTVDPGHNGSLDKKILNSFEMLRLCPSIPQTYKEADAKLFKIYFPIVNNPNISIEEQSKYMIEWYTTRVFLLKGNKLPRDELQDIARNASLDSFREGVHGFISWSKVNKVPLMVLSAGLGDAVEATLEAKNLLLPNVKVISNFLALDHEGAVIGLKRRVIHNNNKKYVINNSEYKEFIDGRKNVILLGDGIWDANMTDTIPFENKIKIGFLNSKKINHLQAYLDSFDIVLVNDQTMDIVNAILTLIL